MKWKLFLLTLVSALFLSSCALTVIPNSAEAKERMENLGYSVNMFIQYGDDVSMQNITQVTILNASLDDDYLQVYFFANEEDTDTFFEERKNTLGKDTEVIRKNKYSIYRGTEKAVNDFLGK